MIRPPVLKSFFDGGCRPNPGPIEVAVVARGEVHFFNHLGEGGSGEAEWLALCLALETAHQLGIRRFDLLGDSRSTIEQANGIVPCRGVAAQACRERFQAASAILAPRRIRWIPRHQNLAGIALQQRHDGKRQLEPRSQPDW
ncbi:reverse transcriptase-like protein [Sphingomonas sp. LHG3406-1]|uniref:reverse transcriptase-like protein n=1 Tax=Sphingomonas sp. LHG3406-1 TaxID=2804617 RepID=UPI00260874EF|nr:reverse transcriptase-like protein [Sphingomonas sp. LHG3406-1]